jgi:hypothetical protein
MCNCDLHVLQHMCQLGCHLAPLRRKAQWPSAPAPSLLSNICASHTSQPLRWEQWSTRTRTDIAVDLAFTQFHECAALMHIMHLCTGPTCTHTVIAIDLAFMRVSEHATCRDTAQTCCAHACQGAALAFARGQHVSAGLPWPVFWCLRALGWVVMAVWMHACQAHVGLAMTDPTGGPGALNYTYCEQPEQIEQ